MKTAALLLASFAAALAAPPDFSGAWRFERAIGAAPPAGFALRIVQAGAMLQCNAHWDAKDRRYGLTLLGIVASELRLSTAGAEDLNQVGPFVLHSRSRWEGEKLITEWRSSSFQGQSFQGTWTRRLSADGRELILEIAATPGNGTYSHAQLVFRRE